MHIVFFSMWYDPEPVGKPHLLAKELIKHNNKVTVITGYPNYPTGEIYEDYINRGYINIEFRDGVKIIRIRSIYISRSKNYFKRLLSILSYTIVSFFYSLVISDADLVWTYQIAYPGTLLSLFKGIKHIHEVQDLWPDWAEGSLVGSNRLLFSILKKVQKYVYMQSSALITISNGFKNIISNEYKIERKKIYILPNWANNNAFDKNNHLNAERHEFLFNKEECIITYGGNIGTAQGLYSLIKAAELLYTNYSNINIKIIIAGDGVEKKRLMKMCKINKINNVIFFPKMPPANMGRLLAVSDWLYIGLSSNKIYEITIPSKTYSYLAAGKPILCAANGEISKFISENNIGFISSSDDIENIARIILKAYSCNDGIKKQMAQNAYDLYKYKYNGSCIGMEYIRIIESIMRYQHE